MSGKTRTSADGRGVCKFLETIEGWSSKSAVGCAAVLIGVCNFHPKSDPYYLEGVINLLLSRMD